MFCSVTWKWIICLWIEPISVYLTYNELKIMKLVPPAGKFTYDASIMLMLFHAYCFQNYAGIIGTCLATCKACAYFYYFTFKLLNECPLEQFSKFLPMLCSIMHHKFNISFLLSVFLTYSLWMSPVFVVPLYNLQYTRVLFQKNSYPTIWKWSSKC